MKKALSMALAATLTTSLVSFSASAHTFTDSKDVNFAEAVDVVSAVSIIDGYADGSFNPSATLTRGAAAKIICNMMLGPTTAGALSADVAPFPDVAADHTFAGYIAYCAQQGIISGYEDGSFRPAGEVTAYQFMKMLLGALGYNSNVEGFTGSNWSVNVAKLALALDLEDGNEDFVGSAAMSREEACLYAFNTMQATMVEYESLGSNIVVGDLVVNTGASKATEKTNTSSSDGNIADDGLMQFAESYFKDLKQTATSEDDFGRPAREWKVKTASVGTYVDATQLEASYVGEVTRGTLYTLLGKSLVGDLEDGVATLTVYEDGFKTVVDADDVTNYIRSSNSTKLTGHGAKLEVFVDDDDNVTIVIANTYLFQATGDYSASNEEVKITSAGDTAISLTSTTISVDDFAVEDVMEDDYLLAQVTRSSDSGAYTLQTIEVAELLTGTVDSYSVNSSVTIDGVKYNYAATTSDVTKTTYSVGEETSVVLDGNGNIIGVDEVVASTERYVFIRDTGTTGTLTKTVVAAGFFVDGTYEEITLKKVDGSTADADMEAADGWYSYSVDSNDKYTLTALDSDDEVSGEATFTGADGAITVTTSGKVSFLTGESVKGNSSTIFVTVDDDDDLYTYTGVSNLPTIKTGSTADSQIRVHWMADASNNYASYVFIDMSDDAKANVDDNTASSSDYVFILNLDATSVDGDGDTYYVYNAIVDGEETTINAEDDGVFAAGKLYNNIKTNSADYVSSATEITHGDEYATGEIADVLTYSDGTLELGGEYFIVHDNTEIVLISSASDLNKDDDADYELSFNLSGKSLSNLVKEYGTITGSYVAILEDDNSETVDVLYISITDVAE